MLCANLGEWGAEWGAGWGGSPGVPELTGNHDIFEQLDLYQIQIIYILNYISVWYFIHLKLHNNTG